MVWISESGEIVAENPRSGLNSIRQRPGSTGTNGNRVQESENPLPASQIHNQRQPQPTVLTENRPLLTIAGLPLHFIHVLCILASTVVFGPSGFLLSIAAWYFLSKKFTGPGIRSGSQAARPIGLDDAGGFFRQLLNQQPPGTSQTVGGLAGVSGQSQPTPPHARPMQPADPWGSKGRAYKLNDG